MKNRIKKWVNFILIAFLLVAVGIVLYSVTVYQNDFPDYSTYSAKPLGIKALYLLSQKMGYQVQRNHYPAKFLEDGAVMVVYRPGSLAFNEPEEQEYLEAWMSRGNTMVLVPDPLTISELWIFNTISEQKTWHEVIHSGDITITWYGLDNGQVCIIDQADAFMNTELKDSDAAPAFIQVLERIGNTDVIFNEYYHYLQKPAPGVWELIGIPGQIAAVQLLLALLLTIIRGWKPFGRVRNEGKLLKRPEAEAQKALAGLYMRMKAYPLVLSNYYGYFTQRYQRFLSAPGPLQEKAHHILSACGRFIEENRKSRKELIMLVHQLNRLEDEINGKTRSA